MTITTLILYIGIVATLFTLLNVFALKNSKSWFMSFWQNFTGVLFIFSGWVKAVDPLGTAYKMEEYFDEFAYTFEPTWFGFMKPMFEWFSTISISFSLLMIIFEIILGLMLVLGVRPKLSAWLFFALVFFFTILTGFTYLTGYVHDGGNFFDFSAWGAYKESNMKVTDCGCFGDFIKLEPKTSFMKDIFLMIPATYFVFMYSKMHQFFSKNIRSILTVVSTVGLIAYCMNNYAWNLPSFDFRPFTIGADIAGTKAIEEEAAANVEILEWALENTTTGEKLVLPTKKYFAELKTYSKANGWKVTDQISTKPAVKATKISSFEITDFKDNDVSYEFLEEEGYHFMIVSYKMKYDPIKSTRVVLDSIYSIDTMIVPKSDSTILVKSFEKTEERTEKYYNYKWEERFLADYAEKINPLLKGAVTDKVKVSIVSGGADEEVIRDFEGKTGIKANYYTADDILLKTIIRSNPGVVLWKDGKIVHKWHINKLPKYADIKSEYIR